MNKNLLSRPGRFKKKRKKKYALSRERLCFKSTTKTKNILKINFQLTLIQMKYQVLQQSNLFILNDLWLMTHDVLQPRFNILTNIMEQTVPPFTRQPWWSNFCRKGCRWVQSQSDLVFCWATLLNPPDTNSRLFCSEAEVLQVLDSLKWPTALLEKLLRVISWQKNIAFLVPHKLRNLHK